jgi:outer membrane protein
MKYCSWYRCIALVLVVVGSLILGGGCASTAPRTADQKPEMVEKQLDTVTEPMEAPSTESTASPAKAAEPAVPMDPAHVFTLEECIELTLERNPGYDSSEQDIKSAGYTRWKAVTGFLPTLSADYSYTQLDETPTTRTALGEVIPATPHVITGRQVEVGSRDNYQFNLTVTQPIFTGFNLISQYRLAELGLNVAEILKERARQELILQVKQTYFGVLQAEKALEVTQQSVILIEEQVRNARSFFEVGMVPKNDVLQAEVQLAQSIQDRIVAENNLSLAKSQLNNLLRRPLDSPLTVKDVMCPRSFDKKLKDLIDTAMAKRPEVLAAKRQVEIGEHGVRAAQSGYYPQVALKYTYTREGDEASVNGYNGSSDDPDSWSVTAVASWNFWEWGRTHSDVQISKVDLKKAGNALTEVEDGVKLEVQQAFLQLQAASKNIVVAEKAVEQAEENYRMSEERYREQVATSLEVRDAETLLTKARTNYYNTLYLFCLSYASLQRAIGMEE